MSGTKNKNKKKSKNHKNKQNMNTNTVKKQNLSDEEYNTKISDVKSVDSSKEYPIDIILDNQKVDSYDTQSPNSSYFASKQPKSIFDDAISEDGKLDSEKVLNIVNQYKKSIEYGLQKSKIVFLKVNLDDRVLLFAKKTYYTESFYENKIYFLGSIGNVSDFEIESIRQTLIK